MESGFCQYLVLSTQYNNSDEGFLSRTGMRDFAHPYVYSIRPIFRFFRVKIVRSFDYARAEEMETRMWANAQRDACRT